MKIINNLKRNHLLFLSLFFFLLYLLFKSNNSSLDAWGFAAYIKNGESLFLSHHLLYNAFGFLWVKALSLFGAFDALHLLKILNALFAASILFVLGKTLRMFGVEGKKSFVWVALTGSSWAIMRFATENETYVIPLFFSLLGSYYFIKWSNENQSKSLFLSGLFSAVACLFHQVMFFWWLSLLVGIVVRKKIKPIMAYSLPATIVPILYLLVIAFYYHQQLTVEGVMKFVFRDYYSGAAGITVGLGSIAFLFMNLIRSFFQVHGYIINLVHYSFLYYTGGFIAIVLIFLALIKLRQTQVIWNRIKEPIVLVHLLAIVLQLFFALLSGGNAEFMVMIPVLLVIVISQIIQNEQKFIGFLAAGMLVWNLTFGLIPLRIYDLDNGKTLSEKVLKSENSDKQPLYILFNKPRVENEVKYNTGYYPRNVLSGIKGDSIKLRIDEAFSSGTPVFSDCINRPHTLSRENFVVSSNETPFADYRQTKVDSVQTLTGKYYLYSISKK